MKENESIISNSDIAGLPVREVYYLNNWYRYKENLKNLRSTQLENAKTLFRALKELSDDDRNLLAAKYDRPTIQSGKSKVRPRDDYVAEELGMDVKEYAKTRRKVQYKMSLIMREQKTENRRIKNE